MSFNLKSEKTMNKETDKPTAHAELTHLNRGNTEYNNEPGIDILEAFENSHPNRDYKIILECPEFTALCPITGQPDFGYITISYVADKLCIESKSLKLYLFAYRNHGAFHEEVTNLILDDIVEKIHPRQATVTGNFNPRGGIAINVEASYP
jgi:7-cyano-7-deazaguanine reductase